MQGDSERDVESGVDVDVGDHLDVGSAGAGDSEFDLDRILGDQLKRRGSCTLGLTYLHRAYICCHGRNTISPHPRLRQENRRALGRTLYVSHATVLERDIIDAVIDPCGVCYDMNHEITNQNENGCQ